MNIEMQTSFMINIAVNFLKVVSGDITFAYEYTGRHDTGVLPQLKSSGPFVRL